jgi:hypothetical protein
MVPQRFHKDAHEGDDYTTERTSYRYVDGRTEVDNLYKRNGTVRADTTFIADYCTHDLLSIMYYARTLRFDDMKSGSSVAISCVSGRSKVDMSLVYRGKVEMEANNGHNYRCHHLVLASGDKDAFADSDQAMQIFVTADDNRVPIRIDSKLKVGTMRVILKEYKNLKY